MKLDYFLYGLSLGVLIGAFIVVAILAKNGVIL